MQKADFEIKFNMHLKRGQCIFQKEIKYTFENKRSPSICAKEQKGVSLKIYKGGMAAV